jgi:PAS domain S-box-containing protein
MNAIEREFAERADPIRTPNGQSSGAEPQDGVAPGLPRSPVTRIAQNVLDTGKDPLDSALRTVTELSRPRSNLGRPHSEPALALSRAFYLVQIVLLAAVYFGAAKLGLTMAFVAEQVTAVWPPTGIALAALLLFGYRVWPAVAIGAFLANATAHAPLVTAAGIALGNTLEALAGAWMLRRLVRFDPALGRVMDVLGLMLLAAALSTTVSATIGAASLCAGGVKPWTAYAEMWSVWWLGDALGVLVVAPPLLTWARSRRDPRPLGQFVEAGALLFALTAVSVSVFAGPFDFLSHPALAYALFPFVVWAALRFGPPLATLATGVGSTIAIWGTAHGYGPFRSPTVHESLILLQVFMAVVAATTLVLAAVSTTRRRAETALRKGHDLLRAVIEGTTDAVFVKDHRGRYLMINAAGAAFLGKTVAEVIGRDDTELFTPATARAIMEGDIRIMSTGEVQTAEDVGTAAGVTRTYLSTKAPYRDSGGAILGVIGISRDITERKHADEALHAREREFRLAREIQRGLLPKALPTLAGFTIAGACHPAQETGGDYYDFIPMSDGQLGIAVGDASGHGIGAALLIAETRAYLRAIALTHPDPATILRLVNQRLAEDIGTDHFVTLLFARLCTVTRSLVYSSAGHWPGYVLDERGDVRVVLESTGLPLGIDRHAECPVGPRVPLEPGDLVLLLTDGIVETRAPDGPAFGLARVLETVRACRDRTPDEIVAAICAAGRAFSPDHQTDDVTAVVVKVCRAH